MSSPFAERFRLALKALSISRGRFASELGVDKSLVGRWASGTGGPSADNRDRITQLLAARRPGFTLLDWDRELADFAALFGVVAPTSPEPADNPFHDSLRRILRPSPDANVSAYEGFWRTTHASLFEPGQFCQHHGVIRRADNGVLEYEAGADGIRYRGAMFAQAGQVFAIGGDDLRQLPALMIFNAVAVPKIMLMDGLVLTASVPFRIPTAYPIVCERIGDLSGDRALDDAQAEALMQRPETPGDGAAVPAIVREHLERNASPDAASGVALTAPLVPRLAEIIAQSRGGL